MENIKQNKGITLVALVVTIIILLILAGISISSLTNSGIFEKAKEAEEKSKNAQEQEDAKLADYENKIGEYVDGSRNTTQSTSPCSPKQLMYLGIESSAQNPRPVGTYYASTNFLKNTSEDYSKYLEQTENGKWKVLKSGNYFISDRTGINLYGNNWSSSTNSIIIDDTTININFADNRVDSIYNESLQTTTIYLKEGEIIDFCSSVGNSSGIYHYAQFIIYAMFE